MEAKELQIGDWILLSDTPVCVRAINSIDNQYYIEAERWKLSARNYASVYNPIPLTEDILKANGFEYNGFFFLKKIDTGSINSELLTIQLGNFFDTASVYWRCGGIPNDVHISPSRLKYVHQLQHALRLCGLDELADNFKVV